MWRRSSPGPSRARGEQVLQISPAEQPRDAEQAALFATALRDRGGAKALIHLGGLGDRRPDGGVGTLLLLAQALQPHLEAAADGGGAVILGATRLGGAFGLDGGSPPGAAAEGALPGFLKTVAHEWPGVRVKCVDLSEVSAEEMAAQLLEELFAADGLVEVGYRGSERTHLTLAPAPLSGRPDAQLLDGDSVVLITGGARGITARRGGVPGAPAPPHARARRAHTDRRRGPGDRAAELSSPTSGRPDRAAPARERGPHAGSRGAGLSAHPQGPGGT